MGWDSGGFMGSAGESSQGMDANAVGMGALGGAGSPTGANYGWITRAIIDAYSRRFGGLGYGGNSSLLGIDKSVFGGPMIPDSAPTDENPGGFYGSGIGLDHTFPAPGYVNSIPTPAFVDLTDPNLQDPMGCGVGGTPAGGYSFGGSVPTDANPMGYDVDGGSDRPWWLENTNNGMRPNPVNIDMAPKPNQPLVNWPMPYTRPKRPNLAYGNAYDNAFIGGDDM